MTIKTKPFYGMTSNFGFQEMTTMLSIFCKQKHKDLHCKGQKVQKED